LSFYFTFRSTGHLFFFLIDLFLWDTFFWFTPGGRFAKPKERQGPREEIERKMTSGLRYRINRFILWLGSTSREINFRGASKK
jgi:hypothetical protein